MKEYKRRKEGVTDWRKNLNQDKQWERLQHILRQVSGRDKQLRQK